MAGMVCHLHFMLMPNKFVQQSGATRRSLFACLYSRHIDFIRYVMMVGRFFLGYLFVFVVHALELRRTHTHTHSY